MSNGSGLFSNQGPAQGRFIEGKGGVAGEVNDLRQDVKRELGALAAITVDEYTDPLAGAAGALEAATATQVTPRTATLLAAGVAELDKVARPIQFTTAGGTPADAPATATITGPDANGDQQTEVVNLAQTATTATSTTCFKGTGTTIQYAAGDGTGATVAIGYPNVLALGQPLKTRAGAAAVLKEIEAGATVTTGTFTDPATNPPNGAYAPATAPDGTNDYAVYYEFDPTA